MSRSVTWSAQLATAESYSSANASSVQPADAKPPAAQPMKLQPSLKKPLNGKTSKYAPPIAPTSNGQVSPVIVVPQSQSQPVDEQPVSMGKRKTRRNSKEGEGWRKHGKLFRARLIMEDEESGGNTFVLSDDCSIERYYQVAERVLDQFLDSSIDESQDMTESYLIGNRLVKFLSTVLPSHGDYLSDEPRLKQLRNRSQDQLIQLLQYLEQFALIIDEDEFNKFILQALQDQRGGEDNPPSPVSASDESDAPPPPPLRREPSFAFSASLPPSFAPQSAPPPPTLPREASVASSTPSFTPRRAPAAGDMGNFNASPISNRSPHSVELDATMSSSEDSLFRSHEANRDGRNTTIESSQSMARMELDLVEQENLARESHARLLQANDAAAWDARFSLFADQPNEPAGAPRSQRVHPSSTAGSADPINTSFNDLIVRKVNMRKSIGRKANGKGANGVSYDSDQKVQESLFALRDQSDTVSFEASGVGEQLFKGSESHRTDDGNWFSATRSSNQQVGDQRDQIPGQRKLAGWNLQSPGLSKTVASTPVPMGKENVSKLRRSMVKLMPERRNRSAKPGDTSPQSVMDLSDWISDEKPDKFSFETSFGAPFSPFADKEKEVYRDEMESLATNEAEEVSLTSLTNQRLRGRRPLRHFKGCVRCFLE